MENIKFTINDNTEVTIEVTQEKLKTTLEKIIEFAKKTNQVSGEGIAQDDDCNIYASNLLGEIWDDILKPEVNYED